MGAKGNPDCCEEVVVLSFLLNRPGRRQDATLTPAAFRFFAENAIDDLSKFAFVGWTLCHRRRAFRFQFQDDFLYSMAAHLKLLDQYFQFASFLSQCDCEFLFIHKRPIGGY